MGAGAVSRAVLKAPRPATLIAALSVVAVLSTASSWGALALALRSLESVWHDRVEALAFLHGVARPLERAVPALVGPRALPPAEAAVRLRDARASAEASWRRYLATRLTADEALLVREVRPAVTALVSAADGFAQALATPGGGMGAAGGNAAGAETFLSALETGVGGLERLVAMQLQVTQRHVEVARGRYGLARAFLLASMGATCILLLAMLQTARSGERHWRRRGRGGRTRSAGPGPRLDSSSL